MGVIKIGSGKFVFLLPAVLFAMLIFPVNGWGGVVKTRINCGTNIKENGNVCMDCKIKNNGTVTAYNAGIVVFLGNRAYKSGGLGHIQPGEWVNFNEDLVYPDLLPGEYVVVVRVTFEEMNGKIHKAFHFSSLLYRIEKKEEIRSKLDIHMDGPVFNEKIFLNTGPAISLVFKNGNEETIKPVIHTYLPDGCFLEKPAKGYTLHPQTIEIIKIPLSMGKGLRPGSRFDVVAGYEISGIHYSKHLKGKIIISNRPFYFRFFVAGSVFLIIICIIAVIMSDRRAKNMSSL